MTRLMRPLLITGSVAMVVITTSLYGQDAAQEVALSPAAGPPAKVVVSTVSLSRTQEPAAKDGAGQPKVAPPRDDAASKLQLAEKNAADAQKNSAMLRERHGLRCH